MTTTIIVVNYVLIIIEFSVVTNAARTIELTIASSYARKGK